MPDDVNEEKPVLGAGSDITGRQIQYCGFIWTVTGKNYLGDWDVERIEQRPTGSVKMTSSIDAFVLSAEHPHYALLIPPN
jgi:hypothetical protein